VEVRWPSGLVERFAGLGVDGIRMVKEEAGEAASEEKRK